MAHRPPDRLTVILAWVGIFALSACVGIAVALFIIRLVNS
jgi:hypothetical protein